VEEPKEKRIATGCRCSCGRYLLRAAHTLLREVKCSAVWSCWRHGLRRRARPVYWDSWVSKPTEGWGTKRRKVDDAGDDDDSGDGGGGRAALQPTPVAAACSSRGRDFAAPTATRQAALQAPAFRLEVSGSLSSSNLILARQTERLSHAEATEHLAATSKVVDVAVKLALEAQATQFEAALGAALANLKATGTCLYSRLAHSLEHPPHASALLSSISQTPVPRPLPFTLLN
jgi:hypothetical protein